MLSEDATRLHDLLKRGVFLRDGDGSIDLGDEDPVHVFVVMSVEGYGPHEAAIAVDQNRYHASQESALQAAYEILEMYWWENYREHHDELVKDYGEQTVEDHGMFTETFDGQGFTLSPEEAAAAISGTEAEKFIDVDDPENDEY